MVIIVKKINRMRFKIVYLGLFLALSALSLEAQPTESGEAYLKEYERRIRKEMLNDVYIPKDLNDAFKELTRLTDKAARAKFISAEEDVVVKKLYFSLGRWILHNWGFHGGSRMSHFLKTKLGVSHPEDQAVFIIRTYHRSLNKKDLNVKEIVEQLKEHRQKERIKNKTIIKTEKRKKDQ